MKLTFLGVDFWDNSVYKDEAGRLWKDLDSEEGRYPSLHTTSNNEFDGEPDVSMSSMKKYEGVKIEFVPERVVRRNDSFNYMMLDRLRSDCDYYLGWGGRNPTYDIKTWIEQMKNLWAGFPQDKKPEWLTFEQILQYEEKMMENVKLCPICNAKLMVFASNDKKGSSLKWEWQCRCGYTNLD